MNPKTLRLRTLIISTALLLAALAAGGTTAAAAPQGKKCPSGKVPWKLDGRLACLSGALPRAAGDAGSAMAELWLRDASRSRPGAGLRLTPALRRSLPQAGARLAREVGKVGRMAGAASASAYTSGEGRGRVTERIDHVVGPETFDSRVLSEGRIRGRVFEDGSMNLEVEFTLRDRDGNSVLFTPDLSSLFTRDEAVGCPTADGLVKVQIQGEMGGTAIRMKGKRVIGSRTASQSWRVRARGQVGTDARLHSVSADITMALKNYERGLQEETTVGVSATLSRQGAPRVTGAPTADVRVRAVGASRAEERRYEQEMARALAGSAELAEALAGTAKHSRQSLLEAEPGWYAIPNDCAQLTWTPSAPVVLEPGETRPVDGVVVAERDGRQASGRIEVLGVSRGRFAQLTPSFGPGSPAKHIATGADPDPDELSVEATAIATSTAGRAQASWSARATPVKVPLRFDGPIAATSSIAGMTRTFAGSASYTRTSVVRGPDGSVTAWYELTAAALGSAKTTLGPTAGCRYEATGTGGEIEAGDLELRVLPDGEVLYALLYDLRLPSQFVPTDCPPDQATFEGEIAATLNTRRPGPVSGQLRPAGAGFELIGAGAQDVTAEEGVTTVASWTLMPS